MTKNGQQDLQVPRLEHLIRPCKSTAAFISQPKRNMKLDLSGCADKFREAGYKVTDASVLLIVEKDEELTVYKTGKILIKTESEETAKREAEEAYRILSS